MKNGFIITMLLAALVLTGCNTNEGGKTEEVETEYFDFTVTEIINGLEECLIDFTSMAVIDNEEKTEKIATYGSITDVFNTNKDDIDAMIHYRFNYDDTTYKVSHISFFMDRNSTDAGKRYLYHIYSIANFIEPNTNTDDISTAIKTGFNDCDFATYKSENFELNASRSDEWFNVSFIPIETTKGD